MAERLERPNGRMLILMTAATIGFGLLQGARLVDVNSGPYSASPLALWGLAVDGAVFSRSPRFRTRAKSKGGDLFFSRAQFRALHTCSWRRSLRTTWRCSH